MLVASSAGGAICFVVFVIIVGCVIAAICESKPKEYEIRSQGQTTIRRK